MEHSIVKSGRSVLMVSTSYEIFAGYIQSSGTDGYSTGKDTVTSVHPHVDLEKNLEKTKVLPNDHDTPRLVHRYIDGTTFEIVQKYTNLPKSWFLAKE